MGKYWYGKARIIEVGVSAVSGSTTAEVPVFAAPWKCKIVKASFIPKTAITGAQTNNMTLGFKNKGADGNGTDVIASRTFDNGVDSADFIDYDLGVLAYNELVAGAVVSFYKAVAGTGMNMPDLVAKLEVERV